MKKLPLLLLLPALAHAESLSFQDVLKGLGKSPLQSSSLQCVDNDSEDYEQCGIDLCGKPETATVAAINDANFDQYVKEGTKEKLPEIDPYVAAIFEKKKKKVSDFLQKLQDKMDSESGLKLDISKLASWQLSTATAYAYDPHISTKIDKTKPLEERLNIEVSMPSNADEEYKKALNDYVSAKKNMLKTSVKEGLSNDLYTTEEGQKLLHDKADAVLADYKAYKEKFPWEASIYRTYFEKLENPDTFKVEEAYKISSAYSEMEWLDGIMRKARGEAPLPEPEACPELCRKGLVNYFSSDKMKDLFGKVKKKVAESTLEAEKETCYAEMITKSLKQSDKEKFLAEYPAVKKNFMQKALVGFSEHSKEAFSKYIDEEIHLSFLKGSPDEVDTFVKDLKKKSEEELPAVSEDDITLVMNLFEHRKWYDEKEADAKVGACEESGGAFAAWDAFVPKEFNNGGEGDMDPNKDNIEVSLFSCTHLAHGKGVISHEMGHALSYAFFKGKLSKESEDAFNALRKCVSASYVNPPPGESGGLLYRPGDTVRTEEDMADVISYMATFEEKRPFTCALFETNKKGDRYIELSLKNKMDADPHSAPLLRALREALYKKTPLSPACRSIMEKNKDIYRFHLCTEK